MDTDYKLVFVSYCVIYTFYDKVIESRGQSQIRVYQNAAEDSYIHCVDINNNDTADFYVESPFYQKPNRANMCLTRAADPIKGPDSSVALLFKFNVLEQYLEFKNLVPFD